MSKVKHSSAKTNRKSAKMLLLCMVVLVIVILAIAAYRRMNAPVSHVGLDDPVIKSDCYYDDQGNPQMLQTFDINGNPEKIEYYSLKTGEIVTSYTFKNTYKKGNLMKARAQANGNSSWTTEYSEYNEQGDPLSWTTTYDATGTVYHYTATYKYFDNGKMQEQIIDRDGTLLSADTFDKDGNHATNCNYEDGIWYQYTYDIDGYIQSSVQYNKDSVEQARVEFVRHGNEVTSTVYYPDGTNRVNSKSLLNDLGYTVETTYYELDGSISVRKYEYY